MNRRVLATTTAHMNWELHWRGLLFENIVRSHSPQLAAQVLFPCAVAQHDATPPQQNSEVQAHAHSHRDYSDSPRPHAQRPVSYYNCSEGGVIKYEAREFFKDLLPSGFITQVPVQQTKIKLPDMSAFDNSGQPCYLTALHVSTNLSVWETSKQVIVPRCAWAVKAAGVESSVEIL